MVAYCVGAYPMFTSSRLRSRKFCFTGDVIGLTRLTNGSDNRLKASDGGGKALGKVEIPGCQSSSVRPRILCSRSSKDNLALGSTSRTLLE